VGRQQWLMKRAAASVTPAGIANARKDSSVQKKASEVFTVNFGSFSFISKHFFEKAMIFIKISLNSP
jgi:hypothetical protein